MHTSESGSTDIEQAALQARVRLLSELNALVRRLRQYKTEAEWAGLVLEGARRFARQIALFAVENGTLHLRGHVNLALPDSLAFPLDVAAAFQSVCATKDPVTALRNPAEVTQALSIEGKLERAHLLPILNGTRVAAILFAAGNEEPDLNGLEFITGLASSILERPSNAARHAQIAVLPMPTNAPAKEKPAATNGNPNWAILNVNDRLLHIRARRFSRAAVAELQLSKPDAFRAGREQCNIYSLLSKEIDRSRELYRKQFMTIPSMADYLHMELVQIPAEGDESKLGADYPGPLL